MRVNTDRGADPGVFRLSSTERFELCFVGSGIEQGNNSGLPGPLKHLLKSALKLGKIKVGMGVDQHCQIS
jgi:hypothetical protein